MKILRLTDREADWLWQLLHEELEIIAATRDYEVRTDDKQMASRLKVKLAATVADI